MRRADRLFRLVQLLRKARVATAGKLARELEVSERTVYRDVRDLVLSGVPIRGEAGTGYTLAKGFDLPPLMFTVEEIEALVLGARVVQSHADPELAKAAKSVLAKVELVLPEKLRGRISATALLAPGFRAAPAPHLGALRSAIRERRKVRFQYRDREGKSSERQVWPLAVAFWGKSWTLASWCETRRDFRAFRLVGIERLEVLTELYPEEEGKTLADFAEHAARNPPAQGGRDSLKRSR